MANTLRKAAAAFLQTREDVLAQSVGSRKHRIANGLARQGTQSPEKPCRLEILVPMFAAAAETAAVLHARSNGSTVSATCGNLLGRSGFAVSTYRDKSIETTEVPTRDLLFAFALLNANLLLRPGHALGTWFDCRRKRHVLDVVVCLASLESAIRLGRDHGQQAIFDLKEAREISLGSVSEALLVEPLCEES